MDANKKLVKDYMKRITKRNAKAQTANNKDRQKLVNIIDAKIRESTSVVRAIELERKTLVPRLEAARQVHLKLVNMLGGI